jgi:hypothetical protein
MVVVTTLVLTWMHAGTARWSGVGRDSRGVRGVAAFAVSGRERRACSEKHR